MTIFEKGRRGYRRYLLGEAFDPTTPDGRSVVQSVELVARGTATGRNPTGTMFESPSLPLYARALAYRTPGTAHYGEPAERDALLAQLDAMNAHYNRDTPRDHWWLVQVGDPLRILDTLFLLEDDLPDPAAAIAHWTDVILYFQDSYGRTAHGRLETGANMMWKVHVYFLCGLLREDQAMLDQANQWLAGMMHYSHKISHPRAGTFYDDGFFPDGSFIQHYFFAYAGGYGKHMLCVFAGLVWALAGTGVMTLPEEDMAFFCTQLHQAFLPLLAEGRFMDIARGREISRCNCEDVICGRFVLRALCYLADALPEPLAAPLRAAVKQNLAFGDNRAALCRDEDAFAEHYVLPSLPEVLARLDASATPAAPALRHHYNFGPMAKAVHRHGRWSAAIGMFSPSIACYEYLHEECTGFWHIADGALYLYTDEDPDAFSHNYHGTVDRMRLPGTTVDRDPDRIRSPHYIWYQPDSKNPCAFVGGAARGEYGLTGFAFRGQGMGTQRTLAALKSWFFLGDEIVCLGSGITSPTGDEVETTVLNQRLLPGAPNALTVDGQTIPCRELDRPGALACRTVHLAGDHGAGTGVWFPRGGDIHMLCEHRMGSWNSLEPVEGRIVENDFYTLWLAHGRNPENARYTYVLLPGASAADTAAYAAAPAVEVLACDETAHAVRSTRTGWTGCNFWQEAPARCAGVEVNTQASVLWRVADDRLTLAAADPTKLDRTLELTLDLTVQSVEQADPGITVLSTAPLRLRLDTTDRDGASLCLTARV